jgi:hypothetical protein
MAKAKKSAARFGVLRPDGTWVIEPRFAHAGVYNDERLPVSENGKLWGFTDATGELATPARYVFVFNFLSGAASVETAPQAWDVIDREGKPLALWRGVTRDGRIRASTGRSVSGHTKQFEPTPGPTSKWGMIDEHGSIIVEPSYDAMGDLMEGFACAFRGGQTVYFDRDGKVALGPFAASGRGFANGWARLRSGGQGWFFIDRTGATVLSTEYLEMEPFREDRAFFKPNDSGLYGVIDRTGQVLAQPTYSKMRPFANGLAAVSIGDPANWRSERWGFLDATGAEIIAPTFVRVTDFSDEVAGASVYPEGTSFTLHGLIDRSGAWRLEPTHAQIDHFVDGVAKFVHHAPTTSGRGKEGLLDPTGTIIADGYTYVDWGRGFPAAVNKGGRQATDGKITGGTWGFIDATGAEVIPCQFAALGSTFGAGFGFATVSLEGRSDQ